MSLLTEKDVTKIAKLARIKITDSDKLVYIKELSSILEKVEELNELNNNINENNIDELLQESLSHYREDIVVKDNNRQDILINSPDSEFDCFKVPKVIE
jgi:aspartyl-tRNA(Asn)/glutamyl-tRNA(Gln) amidotransferase subunit C